MSRPRSLAGTWREVALRDASRLRARARAATLYPSDFRAAPQPIRLTLLAALCSVRTAEITDELVDLLIALVLKIDTRAEQRVEGELMSDLKRVRGKDGILFRLADAALAHPDCRCLARSS